MGKQEKQVSWTFSVTILILKLWWKRGSETALCWLASVCLTTTFVYEVFWMFHGLYSCWVGGQGPLPVFQISPSSDDSAPPQKKTNKQKKHIRKQVHARHVLRWHNNDWKQLSRPPQFSTECPLALWRTPCCSAQVYELMIWPDQVSCFVPGFRCVIFTSTACTFRFLGGIRLTLYVTSSPSTGTYSPSMLKEKSQRVLSQDSKSFYEKKRSHAQLANVDGGFLKVQPQLTTLSSGKEQEVILFRSWKPNQ